MGEPARAAKPASAAQHTDGYIPRDAQSTVLHGVVADSLERFLAQARDRDRNVPRFVEREFRAYLECGIAANGLVRVHCDGCGHDEFVPFSCKGRGFCPSCCGRRMSETATHLVDRVFPEVPVRQWVLSLPIELRYRMAFDASLTGEILTAFIRALFMSLRRRAREQGRIRHAHPGSVTFLQRFGDALNLNVHFHVLALDGVFNADGPSDRGGTRPMAFVPLEAPDEAEILKVAKAFAKRLARLLKRRGLGGDSDAGDPGETDPLQFDEPLLAELAGASVTGRVASGPRAGQRARRLGDYLDVDTLPQVTTPGCVSIGRINLHAAVAVPASDRRRLERLCRYTSRPPLATERLSRRPDGLLVYKLRHRWRDGTTHMLFEPMELMERLTVLVPPPRSHMTRYHGILAPRASWREDVVPPTPATAPSGGHQHLNARAGWKAVQATLQFDSNETVQAAAGLSPSRTPWAVLLERVFGRDVLKCPQCGRRMRIVGAVRSPEAIRAILDRIRGPSRPPPGARPDPGRLLPFGA